VKKKFSALVCDANILIDYFDNNEDVLKFATQFCYEIYVPIQVFKEVEQMTEKDANRLGIKLIEPTLAQLVEASMDNSALSNEDYLCFLIAKGNEWICATNEKALYNKCKREKVNVIRGLKIMLELNSKNILSKQDAIYTANKIKDSNPRLPGKIIDKFIDMLS
jgi:rRNA-processing protein FCF1